MSESISEKKELLTANLVWFLFALLTIVYGIALALIQDGIGGFEAIARGLWSIYTSPAILVHDYFALAGAGAALINSAMSGLLILLALKIAKQPVGGSQMGALGLVMGFALLGKNPANMIPILVGGYIYSLYKKEPYKNNVTASGFATCLAPIVSQTAHTPQIVESIGIAGAIALGIVFGLFIGFIINSMAGFIRKSHEGLNLYNVGWGAGLIAIAFAAAFNALGMERFGPGSAIPGVTIASVHGVTGYFNMQLNIYLAVTAVFFLVMGFLAGGVGKHKAKEIFNMKADDNNFYEKYGKGPTYLAMGLLTLMALILSLVFRVHLDAPIMGAILSMIGWGGFGKAVVNSAILIGGVMLGGLARFLFAPGLLGETPVLTYFSVHGVIWSSAFWGTCLSPMAKFFGWKWALLIGMCHFFFASSIAPFHWGMNLYNNGLAAGFVCVVMIQLIRAFDRKGKYPQRPL